MHGDTRPWQTGTQHLGALLPESFQLIWKIQTRMERRTGLVECALLTWWLRKNTNRALPRLPTTVCWCHSISFLNKAMDSFYTPEKVATFPLLHEWTTILLTYKGSRNTPAWESLLILSNMARAWGEKQKELKWNLPRRFPLVSDAQEHKHTTNNNSTKQKLKQQGAEPDHWPSTTTPPPKAITFNFLQKEIIKPHHNRVNNNIASQPRPDVEFPTHHWSHRHNTQQFKHGSEPN